MTYIDVCRAAVLLVALLGAAAAVEQWQATHGPITQVPFYTGEKLPSKHYGGYITVGNKQLYYYMVESEGNPAKDPVV